MNPYSATPSFCGERQLANNEKLSSAGVGLALWGDLFADKDGKLATIPRSDAALPRVGLAGLMDPNPVVMTVFPSEGSKHENE